MFTRLGSSDEPDHFARVLALKGLDRREGNLAAARASFAESLSTRERMLGGSHPLAAESRAQLALVDFGLGSRSGTHWRRSTPSASVAIICNSRADTCQSGRRWPTRRSGQA
jgi:hypothetical protein